MNHMFLVFLIQERVEVVKNIIIKMFFGKLQHIDTLKYTHACILIMVSELITLMLIFISFWFLFH